MIRSIEFGEKPQQRALSTATASNDGEKLSRRHMEPKAVQHLLTAKAASEVTHGDRSTFMRSVADFDAGNGAGCGFQKYCHWFTPFETPDARTDLLVRERGRQRRQVCPETHRSE